MSLPISRNTTYAAGSQIKSADLNDIQDKIVGLAAGLYPLFIAASISPAAIGGTVNDYAPADFSTTTVVRQDLSAAATLTGLAGGAGGRFVVLINIDPSLSMVLSHEGAGSAAGNRLALPRAASYALRSGQVAMLLYDATISRWRLVGGNGESMMSRVDVFHPGAGGVLAGTPAFGQNGVLAGAGAEKVSIPLMVPVGRRITAVRIRGEDPNSGSFCRGELFRTDSASGGVATQVGADMDSGSAFTGSYNLSISGLTEDVISGRSYSLAWESGGAGDQLRAIELTTEPTP